MTVGMDDKSAILAEIEAFAARQNMALTTFGQKAVRDTKLVARLQSGGDITMGTVAKIRAFMTAQKPRRRPRPTAPTSGAAA